MAQSKPRSVAEEASRKLWRQAGMGVTMASEIVAAMVIGWLLDKAFGTQPTLMITFTVAGVVIGMATFIRSAMKESRAAAREATHVAEHMREIETDSEESERRTGDEQ